MYDKMTHMKKERKMTKHMLYRGKDKSNICDLYMSFEEGKEKSRDIYYVYWSEKERRGEIPKRKEITITYELNKRSEENTT